MATSKMFDPNLLAWIYDQQMEDWSGELDFYLGLAKRSVGDSPEIIIIFRNE